MSDEYEVYRRPSAGAAQPESQEQDAGRVDRPWQVLIEYSNRGQSKPPTIVHIPKREYADRNDALTAAARDAFTYEPPDPFSPQGRKVYRDGPDGYLVVISGAMSTFHFSVRIVQHLGDA